MPVKHGKSSHTLQSRYLQSYSGSVHSRSGRWHHGHPHRTWHPPRRPTLPWALPQEAVAELAAGPLSDITGIAIVGGIVAGAGWSLLPILSGRAQVLHSYHLASAGLLIV